MNKRQRKKYNKKISNLAGMSIKLHFLLGERIKEYYKYQKFMNKHFRKSKLWRSI